VVLLVLAIASTAVLGYQWTQTRYFVGVEGSTVAIYQGIQQDLGPIKLSILRVYDRQQVEKTISASSIAEAERIVERLYNATQ